MRIMAPKILENPSNFVIKGFRLWGLDWRFFIILLPALFLLVVVSLFSSLTVPFLSHFYAHYPRTLPQSSRIAVCLVGGARRFELTGPSIIRNILNVYPNIDLFLHAPLDNDAYKFSLLKNAPKIAVVRVFMQKPIPESESHHRVLTSFGSPNGIQIFLGLLQYFNLVEGCISMITMFQQRNNFTYDWIVRTRVDGYWSAPLDPELFISGHYLVPSGSSFGGLNDRFGLGDLNSSKVVLSRLSLLPVLDSLKFSQLTSEGSFKAQLTKFGVRPITENFENGWEEVFDTAVGKKFAADRKRVSALNLQECVRDFEEMRKKTYVWNAPTPAKICSMKFKVLT